MPSEHPEISSQIDYRSWFKIDRGVDLLLHSGIGQLNNCPQSYDPDIIFKLSTNLSVTR